MPTNSICSRPVAATMLRSNVKCCIPPLKYCSGSIRRRCMRTASCGSVGEVAKYQGSRYPRVQYRIRLIATAPSAPVEGLAPLVQAFAQGIASQATTIVNTLVHHTGSETDFVIYWADGVLLQESDKTAPCGTTVDQQQGRTVMDRW